MIIWTIQNERAWESLQKTRRLIAHSHHQADNWPEAYDWMSGQLKKRIGPAPDNDAAPLWGWYHWKNDQVKRPDLRSVRHHWSPAGKYFLLECEMNDDQVLLSDFDAWHIPLNDGYLALTEQENNAFDHQLEKAGWKAGATKPSHLLPEMHDSWERIFDLHKLAEPDWHPIPLKSIQACFWEVTLDQIKSCTPFHSMK